MTPCIRRSSRCSPSWCGGQEQRNNQFSLCGEIASVPHLHHLLIGLGFRSFSVSPGTVAVHKHANSRDRDLKRLKKLAEQVLSASTAPSGRRWQDDWNRRRPVASPEFNANKSRRHVARGDTQPCSSALRAQAGESASAFLSYRVEGERVILEHTFVPDALRGQGIAADLVRVALDEAAATHWKIVPRCSYVAIFIECHPECADLVDRREVDLN
ncbi:N-acetyltransferase [Candidatus Accumulibacter sp. ACC012]|uniref:GNAT family N-acetyltransferase n=1 Tax=Candidatus Accumulibacter sp. ACC012 TaxID=2823332 RepID=UPI0034123D81